ncbi:hypothetical protein ALP66_102383 [Pseudomonas amygdali pv. photiniae]|uniref:Uncharacterized protein n=2 Tax=Pseudomonas syringae group genomosp. 2 TaxID=251698 RepID=A0A0Q0A911_PSESS|nr:hypothetical protein AC519_5496 [Pseudomonas savastanoi]KPW39281.1 hypothetical protein ALO51_102000 [Pseudomonas amygdali]KPX83843.1 hypothetical protein ALO59_101974 [Pseudomonas amygdali pv. mellea]KPY00038.1 hypothetical protein ALO61_101969 [Pseudomonas savastanoi pv. nerii]KPY66212.1 hypothetical protein ALO58_101981 [Pseudomonas savastanoi pv. savastanoi]KUG45252.1 hypothetical protein ALP79_102044 [Pseudomonas savastanoi pv. fraxini]RMS42263.1 hypothetical protein ALP66_102383 [Pse
MIIAVILIAHGYTHVLMTIAPMLRIGAKICSKLVQQPIN